MASKTPAAGRDRVIVLNRTPVRSVADIDGAQAIAERGEHRAGHVASLIDAADVADAAAEVVVMEAPAPAERLRGSRSRLQRHGAERSGGNESKYQFTSHGRSPSM